jgi:hypothetical protein
MPKLSSVLPLFEILLCPAKSWKSVVPAALSKGALCACLWRVFCCFCSNMHLLIRPSMVIKL